MHKFIAMKALDDKKIIERKMIKQMTSETARGSSSKVFTYILKLINNNVEMTNTIG